MTQLQAAWVILGKQGWVTSRKRRSAISYKLILKKAAEVPQLLISQGERFNKEWVFHGVDIITIGRAPTNDIVLPDSERKVSRCHAAIVRADKASERYFVRDLGSLLGTSVDGDIVRGRMLNDGDLIQIGDYDLVYSVRAAAGRIAEEDLELIDVVPEDVEEEADRSTVLLREQGTVREIDLAPERREVLEELLKKARGGCQPEEFLEDLIDPLLHPVEATRGFVGLFRPDRKAGYHAVGLRGLDPQSGERIRLGDPAFLDRLRKGEAVQHRNTLLIPIPKVAGAGGFLCLQRAPSRSFSSDDRRFLSIVARLVTAQLGRRTRPSLERAERFDEPFEWPVTIVGKSEKMREIASRIRSAATTDVSVLLLGETGTGKGVVARAIHEASSRCCGPFVNVDLANLPGTLAESELFGYRRGAFSDAKGDKRGRFELAHKGTIFLDEIGTLGADLQAKLLKPIAEKQITPLGDEKSARIDVRIIVATNKDLEAAVEHGAFARDLYRRINSFRIHLPPLRERREDIALLAHYFLDRYASLYRKQTEAISHQALRLLTLYSWPGNVGELEGYIAAAVSEGRETLFSWDFPPAVQTAATGASKKPPKKLAEGKPKSMEEVEREHLLEVLEHTRGNITRTAEILGWSRMTVLNNMGKYGIPRPSQKVAEREEIHRP